ncbi:MAG: translation initiation factor IF-2 [Bacteroidaceae bacterium]|nr:translation initiation factor IF-2 [Bacteroidaceae bacterium]
MAIRLNKVTRDLNVGIQTVVDYLQKKGFEIETNPNAKISEEQYALLVNEFSTDKDLRLKTEKMMQDRVSAKEHRKEEQKAISTESTKQEFKPIGKIDLSNSGRSFVVPNEDKNIAEKEAAAAKAKAEAEAEAKRRAEAEAEKKAKAEAEKAEKARKAAEEAAQKAKAERAKAKAEEEAAKAAQATQTKETKKAEVNVEKKDIETDETPVVAVKKEEELFRLHPVAEQSGLNVIGKIDLSTINQSTRPKKKSKEERKKERDQKDRVRADQRKQIKDAIIREIRPAGTGTAAASHGPNSHGPNNNNANANSNDAKKKRSRIDKGRVDINTVQGTNAPQAGNSNNSNNNANRGGGQGQNHNKPGGNRGTGYQGNNNNRGQYNNNRNQSHTPTPVNKAEVSDEDVAKQIKETLARLTSKGKTKGSKYRKEKRESAYSRQQEIDNKELAESKILKITEFVTANELATMMDVPVTKVIGSCMSIGMMVSINQRLDAEAINLVAEEFGYKTEYVSAEVAQAVIEEEDAEEDLKSRAPIVTVMGHVDHGKTSLLDYIRKANVIAGEAGGITQHIGAYHVTLEDGRQITFLDTPGHEAFTAMRARGAKVTDIAIIIVAADDDVMPQTKEAINHASAAGVPIVFAINKVDKPAANPEKIKESLAQMNYLVEEWGGKYQSQDISAKKGLGVKELMEKVLLEAEMLELKANPTRNATGSIIESTLDKGRGYVATILVSNGTLKVGDVMLAGTNYGRVKAMFNERNQRITEAGPSAPALVLGLNGAPQAGDTFHIMNSDQEAREIANKREQLQREQGLRTQTRVTLDELGRRIALGDFKELNIIVKGDVDGSIEALSDSLIKLSTERIQVNVIHKAVGQISESDVSLAAASDAIIIAFQVRPSAAARRFAEQEGVDIRMYSIIYDAIEEVKSAMEGMLAPEVKEQITSTIEVMQVYRITKVGLVAGAMVREGKVKRSDKARIIRDGIVVFTGSIAALKRFKDDVKEVTTNFECGVSLTNCNDIQPGDIIESFEEIEIKQTL